MIRITRLFDDRQTDFRTGKKVSPPMEDRKLCRCCGQRIVKGAILSNGDPVGADCADIINRASSDLLCKFAASADEYGARYTRSTGWALRPLVRLYLSAIVFGA